MPTSTLPEPATFLQSLLTRCPQLRPGLEVTCAVSGGPDSMALMVLATAAGCSVTAVHVDHGLRDGSAAEGAVVAVAAERFGASFLATTAVIEPGPNLEARARKARHRVLGPAALTGHTADDQAETMLLNLLRGGALNGLSAMRPERHPLLDLRRAETHDLCRMMQVETVDDPTNRSPVHLRNRVRAELLPLMEHLAGRDLVPLLARQAAVWRDDADHLDALAAVLDPTDAPALAAAPRALARRAVRAWLTRSHPPDLAAVERTLAVARGDAEACEVDGGRRVGRHRQRLTLEGPQLR
ncbi:MAG: tRNA lysidine(34) synthetase TilS [Ilumatobacteraceae bacterium]